MAYREPEFLPWDGRRVPITLVAGYLGAGKTTAINDLLAATDRPIAVIVNDVGEINVDAALIRRRNGDTLELTDGCVCCSAIDGFGAAFDQIRARPDPPDHVVVELSGVAEPAKVVPWGDSAGFLLDGVVTVVAGDQILDDELPGWIRTHTERQIDEADIVVLTKTDTMSPAEATRARDRIRASVGDGSIIDGGRREPGALGRFLAIGGHRNGRPTVLPGPTLFDLHDTATLPIERPIDAAAVAALLDDLAARPEVVRAKGIVETTDGDRQLVQLVGRRYELVPLLASETHEPTDLVVITVRDPSGDVSGSHDS